MGNLPAERLCNNEKPFSSTGIDYFGPIKVKASRQTRRNPALNKRYGVIFVCLTMRAIHIEVANDLSTDCFISALSRFLSRRGHVKTIITDNGTNFVGANVELKNSIKQLCTTTICNYLTPKQITWKFNPPLSPWMGGSWESIIKSIKRALKSITTERIYTDESLSTLLCQVESIHNSRPLTPISDDVNDFTALTPNDLLIGYQSENTILGDFTNQTNIRKNWRSVQANADMFWQKWKNLYLPILNNRSK